MRKLCAILRLSASGKPMRETAGRRGEKLLVDYAIDTVRHRGPVHRRDTGPL